MKAVYKIRRVGMAARGWRQDFSLYAYSEGIKQLDKLGIDIMKGGNEGENMHRMWHAHE
ncbi:MAG TPA: hypothetical protein VN426_01160 [Syntrophomonadaceae bacterium]|nr:hypothetical protein [Syntrophomonadaceae bacterium]